MPDNDTTGQSENGDAPAAAPAPSLEDIQQLIAEGVKDETERRVRGLQSAHDSQMSGLRQELKEAKADPDQYGADLSSKLESDLAASRQETEALRIAREYSPEVFPLYEAVLAAKDPRGQLDLLEAFVAGKASVPPAPEPPVPTAEPAIVPPFSDPNRPVLAPSVPSDVNHDGMDASLADQILTSIGGYWPKG
jgi:hypothetical protein